MASAASFVTNPINVSCSHGPSLSSGGGAYLSPPQNLGLVAQFHFRAMKLGVWRCFSASDSFATPVPTKYRPHIASIAIFWLGVRAVGPPSTQHLIRVPNFMAADMKMGIWRGYLPSGSSDAPFPTISTCHLASMAPPPKRSLSGVPYSTRIIIRVPNFMAADMKMGSR